MPPVAIHQFLPNFAGRDAIGAHALAIRDALRADGFVSDIYAQVIHKEVAREARRADRYTADAGPTWLLYHLSTGAALGDRVLERSEPLIVDYHNITPAEYFAPWEPHVAAELSYGRRQLAAFAARVELGLADSAYNAAELSRLGCARTEVVPILLDTARFNGAADTALVRTLRARRREGGRGWLFVGRLAPNKSQHDVVKAFAAYRQSFDPQARLHLVGTSSSHRYEAALRAFVESLALTGAVNFAGSVNAAELIAYYDEADVFVCLSDHEGFCVPLLEAMHHRLPIVAFAAAAVPETLGRGLCLESKEPTVVASAVHRVLSDEPVRQVLIEAGTRRLGELSLQRSRERLLESVHSIVGARV